ncbi:MAG TPA: hypothetical protein VKX17_26090 [Planctomycetota bacterium]|nr:hypothetical protein [Planctomycetota bacterium]
MKRAHFEDLTISLGEALKLSGKRGALIGEKNEPRYILLPLDDALIDYLVERSPKFNREMAESRKRTKNGERGYTLDEIAKELELKLPEFIPVHKTKRASRIPKNLASKKIA